MDTFDLLVKIWPVLLGFITLVIVLAKMDVRINVLEEKIKTLFELWNKKNER
jgi:hypothetical protein